MEVKLSHRQHFSLPKSLLPNFKETSFPPPHTFSLRSWAATERHRFQGLIKKWRLQNNSKDYICAHLVKELNQTPFIRLFFKCRGETLSSISKKYGVSVYSIAAANKDIVDIHLVFKGQLLNIPASSLKETLLAKKSRLWHSIRAFRTPSHKIIYSMVTSHGLSNAKATGYFLVLVPLIAFCIRCIISTFRIRVARDMRHQAVDKSKGHHPGAKSMRWKSALSDTEESDAFDSESGLDSNSPSEDEAYISYDEASHAYSRLQHDYEKFLSECGMSKWGYWRGGSPGT
ncbi:LysM domain - like 8 [Theobroma cacao]|nr:LysM domain - like 8 [Theobroma cacao]